ncbi:MAG: RimK family alpha-L-glutamate ligase [Candidatus Gracilibacteria bacterium]
MNIAVLYFGNPPQVEIDRFLEAGSALPHNVSTIFVQDFLKSTKPIDFYDCVIPRPWIVRNLETELHVLEQLKILGVPVLNSFHSICNAKNKKSTLDLLVSAGVPITRSVPIYTLEDFDLASTAMGGLPVVAKDPFGTYGQGVMLVKNFEQAKGVLTDWILASGLILVQKFYSEAMGKDTRVLVIGGKAIGAITRQAQKGEFRSNIELGGVPKGVLLTDEYASLAVRATNALGLQVAGVDILESKDGPLVIEVNSNPGFSRVFEKTTGLDVAKAILEFAVLYSQKGEQ